MPKGQGIQTFPIGQGFPADTKQGANQRPFTPIPKKGKGPQVYQQGIRTGATGDPDMQRAHNPGKVKSKGPQVHKSTRLGQIEKEDSSRPYNTE